MTDQLHLVDDGHDDLRPPTERQQAVLDFIAAQHAGAGVDEIGAFLHHRRGRHDVDDRCIDCALEGSRAIREKAVAPRVIRRRGGVVEIRGARPAPPAASSPQKVELSGSTFEDIFGDAA